MKKYFVTLSIFVFLTIFTQASFGQSNKSSKMLTLKEKQILLNLIKREAANFDANENMVLEQLPAYQYHTDATGAKFHHVRSSFQYALALLNSGERLFRNRAFEVIRKTLSLQDQDTKSATCGVWPYYLEEPFKTKKSPPDYNMADFNAVTLIEIWMNHAAILPSDIKINLKKGLSLAAFSIKKRAISNGYTNIALMGTYVTYMAAQISGDKDLTLYAKNRLKSFYDYSIKKGGFTEYNTPHYTAVALDELNRMQMFIVDKNDKLMVDSLYYMGWDMLARHYHIPTAQSVGPNSRVYVSLVPATYTNFLSEALGNKIIAPIDTIYNYRTYGRTQHQVPEPLRHYFTQPVFPRTEIDVFEPDTPQIIGTAYLTSKFALSSCNQAVLWNQRRPLIAYWGSKNAPKYLQVRLLHDMYDFSSASITTQQIENKVLAGVNFSKGLGDKHINIDMIKNGKFNASDLRLRFEFGGATLPPNLQLPTQLNQILVFNIDGLYFNINLFEAGFENNIGYWEKGADKTTTWLDFVLFKGEKSEFDLNNLKKAIAAFTLSINDKKTVDETNPIFLYNGVFLNATWGDLKISLSTDVQTVKKHGGWF